MVLMLLMPVLLSNIRFAESNTLSPCIAQNLLLTL